LQQLIIIIIAICCGITFLAIFAFVLYLIHYRRRFTDDQTVALPLRRANSKVSNEFFVTDKHFPTLTFAELTAAIL
jgi:heme/copper-type cytochrome/quinol oxidase subunit 2